MKANNWNWCSLKTIYVLAIVNCFILTMFTGYSLYPDSPSYLKAWELLIAGEIDLWRTPIYPTFLGSIKYIMGYENLYPMTVCLQHLIFLVSIYYFYHLVKWICQTPKVVFYITLIYAIHPSITTWSNCILTESLSISGFVFLLYTTCKIWRSKSLKLGIPFTFWLFFLIFLRPAFIYLLPIYATWGIFICFKRKLIRISMIYIGSTILVGGLLLFYMKAFQQKYEVFAPSCVSTYNQFFIAKQYNLIDPQTISDKGLKSFILNNETPEDLSKYTSYVLRNYGIRNMQEVVSSSFFQNPIGHLKYVILRFCRASYTQPASYHMSGGSDLISYVISPSLNLFYLLLITYTFILIYWIYRKRVIPYISCLLYMIVCSSLIVSIVGAQGEWGRLNIPVIPVYLLMLGQLCNLIRLTKVPNRQLE